MRSVASDSLAVNGMRHYAAYGTPFGGQGNLGIPFGFTGEQTDANGLVYLRARHYAPSVGIFPSLDPFEGIPSRPMSLNGYSWVEGNVPNMTDSSGNCPANPITIFDHRCWDLARGLASRFNAPVENFSWMTYDQLESATFQVNFYGTLANASIIPSLALREDPRLVIQALQQLSCGLSAFSLAGVGTLGRGGVTGQNVGFRFPRGVIPAGAIGIGIIGGIIILLGLNVLNDPIRDDDDECAYDKIAQRIGNKSVAEVVGNVGNIRSGEPEYHLGFPPDGLLPSGHKGVIGKAMDICKTGSAKPSEYYICAEGVDCKGFRILSDGNGDFVARRVMGQSLTEIEPYIRPSTQITLPKDYGVLVDQEDADYYLDPSFDWINMRWV